MLKPRTDLPANFVIEMEAKSECKLFLMCAKCKGPADPPKLIGVNYYCPECSAEIAIKAMIV